MSFLDGFIGGAAGAGAGILANSIQNDQSLAMKQAEMDLALKQQVAIMQVKQKMAADLFNGPAADSQASSGGGSVSPAMPATGASDGGGVGAAGPASQGASVGNATQSQQYASKVANMSADQIAQYRMITGEDLFPMWKALREGVNQQPGYVTNLTTGKREYLGDPTKGVTLDSAGNVVPMTGAADTLGKLAAATKAGETSGANSQTLAPLDRIDPSTGRPYDMTVGQMVGAVGGSQSAPSGSAQTGYANEAQMRNTAAGDMGADPAALQREIAATKLGIARVTDQPSKDALQGHLDDLMGQAHKLVDQGVASPQKVAQVDQRLVPLSQRNAAANGFNGFAGPADLARSSADVAQQTKPNLDYATTAATAFQKMGDSINGRLSESQDLLKRIDQSRQALAKFQAGGGTDTRLQLAQYGQAIGLPTTWVDKIAGGNVAAVQEFQKFAAQEALQTMQQALATDSGPAAKGNRLAMDLFIKNNPNITTDPRAIEKIFNFQTELHNDALKESDAFVNYNRDPSNPKDPVAFGNQWAHQQIASGRVSPQMVTGQAMGTQQAPSAQSAAPQASAARIPPAGAIIALRGNPQLAAQFDGKYGTGASAAVLGK